MRRRNFLAFGGAGLAIARGRIQDTAALERGCGLRLFLRAPGGESAAPSTACNRA